MGGKMQLREYRDVVGGGMLALIGLVFTWYTIQHYDLGTPNRMGPGMFPAVLGVLLGSFGLLMMILGFYERAAFPEIRIRVPAFVLGSVAAFTLVLGTFGLLPAVLAVTVVSTFAEQKVKPISLLGLCAALCLMSWMIFGVGLRLPIAMLRVPF
jgi:hypothetical protein